MIDLGQRAEPYEIALPYGLSVTVKPADHGRHGGGAGGGPGHRRGDRAAGPDLPRRWLALGRGEPGAERGRCRYRKHALISRQEHEAWDVLLACQGQLRLASSGHVVGIDMDTALEIAAARGCDLAAELLPAVEAGLVEALRMEEARRA